MKRGKRHIVRKNTQSPSPLLFFSLFDFYSTSDALFDEPIITASLLLTASASFPTL